MVTRVGCIRLKLTYSLKNWIQTLESLLSLVKTAVKFRNLHISKTLNTDKTEFFPYLSRLCTYLWGIHSLKKKSAVSRSSYLYGVNRTFSLANTFFFFIKSITRSLMLNTMMEKEKQCFANMSIPKPKVLFWNIYIKNNPLLSKSMLKYLVYCQIFGSNYGVYKSNKYLHGGWCYCIFNNLPPEKTVMQM